MNNMTKGRMMRIFLKGSVKWYVLTIFVALISTLADLVRPRIIEYTIDGILGDEPFELPLFLQNIIDSKGGISFLRDNLWIAAVAVIICSIVAAVFKYIHMASMVRGGETFVKTMRDKLYAHIIRLPEIWHSRHQTGDLIQRCTSDVDEIKTVVSDQLISCVNLLLTIIVAMFFILKVNITLGIVSVIAMPLIGFFSFYFHKKIGSQFRICDENEGALSAIAQENLTGNRVVHAFGKERFEIEKFEKQNVIVTNKWEKLNKYLSIYWLFSDSVINILNLIVLVIGTYLCINDELTVGGLLAVLSYFVVLSNPIRMMGRILSEISKADVSIDRLYEVMREKQEPEALDAISPEIKGEIEFKNVSFGYNSSKKVLNNVSFKVKEGTTLGIMGGTGSGKSTIASLLTKLYELKDEDGHILIDGYDINKLSTGYLRKNIGYVLQDAFLFSKTIKENIKIGNNKLTDDELNLAIEDACFKKSIDGFADGIETKVGERGVTLSGGQKQRAAIARTLSLRTPILIFDDSLSAVDSETDSQIRKNLKKYRGATTIIITHRVSTIKDADNIIVLDDGKIVQQGTHNELYAEDGIYKTVCDIQSGKGVNYNE